MVCAVREEELEKKIPIFSRYNLFPSSSSVAKGTYLQFILDHYFGFPSQYKLVFWLLKSILKLGDVAPLMIELLCPPKACETGEA